MSANRLRPWTIVALIFLVALLNYFDRQSLSVVAPRMQAELHLNDLQYAHIVSLFLMASAFAYALSGPIVDKLGVRQSMTLFVGVWSVAEACTAFTHSMLTLGLTRFCLGLGEPGLWVAAPKAVMETLPKRRHSAAIGLYTLGATVGAIVAVPTILLITAHFPWRDVFLVDGAAGILWLPLWWFFCRPVQLQAQQQTSSARGVLRRLFGRRELWQLMIARGMTDPVWFFYLFWFPKFLFNARHLSAAQVSHFGWVVYLGGGLGSVCGGLLSGKLIRSGLSAGLSYRRVMSLSAVAVLVSPVAFLSPSIFVMLACASIVALAHMSWLINLSAALLDIFPADIVGKAFGLVAAGSAFGGMVSSEVIGYFVTHGGYGSVFVLMACMHPLALALLWTAFRRVPQDVPAAIPEQSMA